LQKNFVESEAKKISIAVAMVSFFNDAISKIFKTWCGKSMLALTLKTSKTQFGLF